MNTAMNTVNQTFNWSRFTAALRKEVVENSRPILFGLLGMYVLLAIIMIFGNVTSALSGVVGVEMETYVPQKIVLFVLGIFVCVAASITFSKLKTKTGRIDLFTSPSSTFEKFLVNVLIYVVGAIVVFFICAQLADLTRYVALLFFKDEAFEVPGLINFLNLIPKAVDGFTNSVPVNLAMKWIVPIGLVASAGMYCLGSVIWPRLSFLKTLAAVYVLEAIIGIIGIILAFSFLNEGNYEAFGLWFLKQLENGNFSSFLIVLNVVQVVLYWCLSWYLFKRKDIISLKWWK